MKQTNDTQKAPLQEGGVVYAVLLCGLDKFEPGHLKRALKDNPQEITKLKVFYVGQTGLTAQQRYEQHRAGYKAGRKWVMNYGVRLIPLDEKYPDFGRGVSDTLAKKIYWLSKRSKADPVARELKVAEILRSQGFCVISH